MIKTAVIGASGYIGAHLFRRYRSAFPDCIGTGFSRSHPDLTSFDLSNPIDLPLQDTGHQAVIFASARTSVDWCEKNRKESYEINVHNTLKCIQKFAKSSITIIYLSSDYVFDGKRGNYTETDALNPLTEYGRQKAEVEREIPNLTSNYLILRLSKIYGTEWKDGTLLDSIAAILSQGKRVDAAIDKIFCPTHVDDLVSSLLYVQNTQARGVLNLCHPTAYSRYDLAFMLAQALDIPSELVHPVELKNRPEIQHIPLNTSLRSADVLNPLYSSFLPVEKAVQRIASHWKVHA